MKHVGVGLFVWASLADTRLGIGAEDANNITTVALHNHRGYVAAQLGVITPIRL